MRFPYREITCISGKDSDDPTSRINCCSNSVTPWKTHVSRVRHGSHTGILLHATDSRTVLHYISSESGRFPVFVSNREQLVCQFSSPSQCNYISTSINPADEASRGMAPVAFLKSSVWLQGSDFLSMPKCSWPQQPELNLLVVEDVAMCDATSAEEFPTDKLLAYFSDLSKLCKVVAAFLRLWGILRNRANKEPQPDRRVSATGSILLLEIQEAEVAVICYVQRHHFHTEIQTLLHGDERGQVSRHSAIFRLNPTWRLMLCVLVGA